MYKTILVGEDVDLERRVLSNLEKASVTAAFWYHFDEEDRWKLVIVSPDVSERGRRALYGEILTILDELKNESKTFLTLDQIKLEGPYSLLYKMIRRRVSATPGVPIVEDTLHDAYIYKMT